MLSDAFPCFGAEAGGTAVGILNGEALSGRKQRTWPRLRVVEIAALYINKAFATQHIDAAAW